MFQAYCSISMLDTLCVSKYPLVSKYRILKDTFSIARGYHKALQYTVKGIRFRFVFEYQTDWIFLILISNWYVLFLKIFLLQIMLNRDR